MTSQQLIALHSVLAAVTMASQRGGLSSGNNKPTKLHSESSMAAQIEFIS